MPCARGDLDRVFSIQTERIVNRDNTVKFQNKYLQINNQTWRGSLAGCRVVVYQHFDSTLSLGFGAHLLGRYTSEGEALKAERTVAVNKQSTVLTANTKHQTGHLMC